MALRDYEETLARFHTANTSRNRRLWLVKALREDGSSKRLISAVEQCINDNDECRPCDNMFYAYWE